MKIRHIALVAAISIFATGNSLAQSSWSNTNTNTNNTSSFGTNSFSLSSNNLNISQSNTNDPDMFCQFFSFSFGLTQIIQIIQGNSFTQVFGSTSDPIDDPCL